MFVRCGVRTHAFLRISELKSDALDHSANLTVEIHANEQDNYNSAFALMFQFTIEEICSQLRLKTGDLVLFGNIGKL